jgi:hypothetical protein
MLESEDHWQIIDVSGALDLTFATGIRGRKLATVKSAPPAARTPSATADPDAVLVRWVCLALMLAFVMLACRIASSL